LRSKKPIKKVGKFIKGEAKRVLEEVETQVIGSDSVRNQSVEKEKNTDNKEVVKEKERKSQLAAARRRLKEIKEELAAARQKIEMQRRNAGEKEGEKELMTQELPSPEVSSKPKSHMPPQIGVERRKKI